MKTQTARGEKVDYTNATSDAITSGQPVVIGQMVGVAEVAIAVGASGAVALVGEHKLAALAGQAWSAGATLYLDASVPNLTTTASTHKVAGRASRDKASAATTAHVILTKGCS